MAAGVEESMQELNMLLDKVDGVLLPIETVAIWEQFMNFQAREDDILIASYPKAGNAWMQEIVDLIILQGDLDKYNRDICLKKVPFLEMNPKELQFNGLKLAGEMASPRIMKTHMPTHLVPKSFWEKNSKIIYVARNGKDTMVSYFYFHKINKSLPNPGEWKDFFQTFLSGQVAWGSWFDHVIGWWKAKPKHQILYVFYEDMIEDPKREIKNVAEFLGREISEELLEKIRHHTSFAIMSLNPNTNYSFMPESEMDQSEHKFLRKGIVGDWIAHFQDDEPEQFRKEYEHRMKNTGLSFRDQL